MRTTISGTNGWWIHYPWMFASFGVAVSVGSLLILAGALNPVTGVLLIAKAWAVIWFFPSALRLIRWFFKD